MPRTKIIRTLPAIEEMIPSGKNFPQGQSHLQFLLECLRNAAQRLRTTKPRIFYSMREVARHSESSLRTVALVYGALEKEGLLNRIHGSQTMLNGEENTRRFSIRGVIGIPIWLKMMAVSPYSQAVNMELEERLRHRGFVADLIFHGTKSEETEPGFSEKLLQHELDIVIWHSPNPRSHQNILRLRNNGIRILAIQNPEAKTDLPIVTYLEDWVPGYQSLARHWQTQGINKVLLPLNTANLDYVSELEAFTSTISKSGLRLEVCGTDPNEMKRKCLHEHQTQKVAIAFWELPTANVFCNLEPLIGEELAKHARIAFCRGPMNTPYLHYRGFKPDVVSFSPSELAGKLAEDIQLLPHIPDGIRCTFNARLWPEGKLEGAFGSA